MLVRIHGNEVIRYHRWLSQSEKLQDEVVTFAVFKKFFKSINETMMQIAVFISILIGLFYFKIPANWLMALKIALVLVAFNIFQTILEFSDCHIVAYTAVTMDKLILLYLFLLRRLKAGRP